MRAASFRVRQITHRYRTALREPGFVSSVAVSVIWFMLGLVANTYAGIYATERASNPVTDIILSNTPAFDVDVAFVYGIIAFIVLVMLLCLMHPKRIPFMLYALGLFFLIRGMFVSMTHLAPYPIRASLDFESKLILTFFGGGDDFFSGHTGAPFLMALLFWQDKGLRYFFIGCSIFFGGVVLLGHIHYTIDVMSAFFITYGIYHIALWLFPRERQLFVRDEPVEGLTMH